VSPFRRTLRPGVGASLHGVKGPRWWRRLRALVVVVAWAARRVCRCVRFAVRHPLIALCGLLAASSGLAVAQWGIAPVGIPTAIVAGVVCLAAGAWWERDPESFHRRALGPVRSGWRRFWTYRRYWQPACATTGLTISRDGHEALPALGRVRAGEHFDVVRARMLPGHTVEAWAKAGEQMAQTFGVEAVRAYPVRGQVRQVELRCRVNDPLRATVAPLPPIGEVDLAAVPVGIREDGKPLRCRVNDPLRATVAPLPPIGEVDLAAVPVGIREDGKPLLLPANRHLLVAGQTGSGKSSCMWALVAGVAPAIQAGLLRIVALDPKRQELSAGAPLWHGHCRRGGEEAVRFLEHAVKLMEERQDELGTRDHTATVKYPQYVILVDEVAALTAWIRDAKLKARATEALGLLLSQGRAAGFIVWQATQLPQKEILDVARDLTPMRVALRTAEANHVDMILGQGARSRGALADQIDPRTPGVCYVLEDGATEPARGRIAHVTDAEIERVAARYAPGLRAVAAVAS
jgi:S-DNA-T family DNA segregation ATPase FtsK/SpoIIIE